MNRLAAQLRGPLVTIIDGANYYLEHFTKIATDECTCGPWYASDCPVSEHREMWMDDQIFSELKMPLGNVPEMR